MIRALRLRLQRYRFITITEGLLLDDTKFCNAVASHKIADGSRISGAGQHRYPRRGS